MTGQFVGGNSTLFLYIFLFISDILLYLLLFPNTLQIYKCHFNLVISPLSAAEIQNNKIECMHSGSGGIAYSLSLHNHTSQLCASVSSLFSTGKKALCVLHCLEMPSNWSCLIYRNCRVNKIREKIFYQKYFINNKAKNVNMNSFLRRTWK